jgi:hypothetical protein
VSKPIQLYRVTNILDPGKNRKPIEVWEGTTLAEMATIALPSLSPEERNCVRIYRSGMPVPKENWNYKPREGEVIVVKLFPAGGDSLRSILQIAVSVVAVGLTSILAPPLAAALGVNAAFVGPLIGFGVQIVGSLLINALVPQRSAKKQKPQYSVQGWKNKLDPDGVVPNVYGEIRYAPPFAAAPYTEIVDEEHRFIRAIFFVSYGPCELNEDNFRIGDTPLSYYSNTKGAQVDVEIREGYPDDDKFTLYNQQVIEEQINKGLVYDEGDSEPLPVKHVSAKDVTKVILDFSFPEGLYHTNHQGDEQSEGVVIRIRGRKVGTPTDAFTDIETLTISKKKTKPFTRSWTWEPPERAQWEFEVTRMNVEQASARKHSQVDWVVVRSFRPEYPLNLPFPAAMVAIRIRASRQLNGVLDEFNLLVKRVLPDWDSTLNQWITRTTRSPAAAFREEMQGPAMSYPRTNAQIDLPEIQEWAEWMETIGSEGMEYDRVHDFEASWRDNVQDIAHAGRATAADRGDKWSVAVDKPATLVMAHITPRNSFNFQWNRPYVKPPDGFTVKFFDRTNDYVETKRIVPWPTWPGPGEPIIVEDVDLPGKTNPDEIYREATRKMYEIIYRAERYTVNQDYESLILTRNDLVYLNHDKKNKTLVGSRIRYVDDGSPQSVTLEDEVTIEAGTSYVIVTRSLAIPGSDADAPFGTIVRSISVTPPGPTNKLILSGPGNLPAEGDLVSFGTADQINAECKVQKIDRGENLTAQLTLIPHAPEIDLIYMPALVIPAWDGRVGEVFDIGTISDQTPGVPSITVVSGFDADDTGNDLIVNLTPGDNGVVTESYNVRHRLTGALSWVPINGVSTAGSVVITGYTVGDSVDIAAQAIGPTGLPSAWGSTTVHIFGSADLYPPTNITMNTDDFPVNTGTSGIRVVVIFDLPTRTDLTYGFRWRIQDTSTAGGLQPGPWLNEIHNEDLVSPSTGRLELDSNIVPGDTTIEAQIAAIAPDGTYSAWAPTTPYVVDTSLLDMLIVDSAQDTLKVNTSGDVLEV